MKVILNFIFKASDSLLMLEMGSLDLHEKDDLKKIEKMQDTIINWNINKTYDNNNNCQTFCNEILQCLEFSQKFKGQLSK